MTATYTSTAGSSGVRSSQRNPCRVCGQRHGCLTWDDGGTLCHHVESDRLTDGGYYHPPADRGGAWSPPPVRTLRAAPRRHADPDACDRAYRAVLAAAGLSDAHRENLRQRGMSDDVIADGLYATLPADGDRAPLIAAATAAVAGSPAGRVPGFVVKDGAVRLVGKPGLLLPVQDVAGRVVALRVRPDDPGTGGKYTWLSTNDDPTGISVDGCLVHVAVPLGWSGTARCLVVTEGELKARLAAERFRVPVLSVPGVGSIRHVAATLSALSSRLDPVPQVAVAYDADGAENPQVLAHERRLARELDGAGFRVVRWVWSLADAKGLDDLLAAGLLPLPTVFEPDADDDRPSSADADPAAVAALRQELARSERIRSLQLQTVANSRELGGDVAGKVALLLAGELAHRAGSNPTPDNYYCVTGDRLADAWGGTGRLSAATARGYVARFAAAGLLDVDERRELVRTPDGTDMPVKRSYIRYDGDLAGFLSGFATGTVYADGEERPQRGGSGPTRRRRLPVECPSCGGETVAVCTVCGETHAATDDPQETTVLQGCNTPDDHRHAEPLAAVRSNSAAIGTSPQDRSSSAHGGTHGFEPGGDGADDHDGDDRSSSAHGEPDGWDDRALAARETLLRRTHDPDRPSSAQGDPVAVPLLPDLGDVPTGVVGHDRWSA